MRLTKEEEITLGHFKDSIQTAYQRSIPVYSNFMSLRERELAFQALEEFYGKLAEGTQYIIYGGYDEAERQVICFLPPDGAWMPNKADFPISCIEISPANKRFSDDLNHRDYLGTVMGLGLTREQIGDILVDTEAAAPICYLFCIRDKAELIMDITRIKHTTVKAKEIDFQLSHWVQRYGDIIGSVSSHRLDAILALAVRISRGKALELIQSGNVFLNGRGCTENAKKLEPGDIFSVRGYGRFRFEETGRQSKKGRYPVLIKQYL